MDSKSMAKGGRISVPLLLLRLCSCVDAGQLVGRLILNGRIIPAYPICIPITNRLRVQAKRWPPAQLLSILHLVAMTAEPANGLISGPLEVLPITGLKGCVGYKQGNCVLIRRPCPGLVRSRPVARLGRCLVLVCNVCAAASQPNGIIQAPLCLCLLSQGIPKIPLDYIAHVELISHKSAPPSHD